MNSISELKRISELKIADPILKNCEVTPRSPLKEK